MFLKDRGYINQNEKIKKLINQGMILGMSAFVYRLHVDYLIDIDLNNDKWPEVYVSKSIAQRIEKEGLNENEIKYLEKRYSEVNNGLPARIHFESLQKIHVDVSLLKGTTDELDIEAFKNWRAEFADAEFILEDGKYITER